jgi:hypothetical protein
VCPPVVDGHHGRDAPRRGVREAAEAAAGRRGGGGCGRWWRVEKAVVLPVRGRARRAPCRRRQSCQGSIDLLVCWDFVSLMFVSFLFLGRLDTL